MERILFGFVLFVVVIGILIAGYFGAASSIIVPGTNSVFYNGSGSENVTIINGANSAGGFPAPPTCTISDNPIGGAISGAVCVVSELGWFASLMVLGSPLAWLQAIFIAGGAVIAWLIIRAVRGN